MSLYKKLQEAHSEEDVKDAYIKALGLKGYSKNLIDIQTKEIWFEAKHNAKLSSYAMFTQLMHYVQNALNKGETIPPFLCVIDTQKAAIMKSNRTKVTAKSTSATMIVAAGTMRRGKYTLLMRLAFVTKLLEASDKMVENRVHGNIPAKTSNEYGAAPSLGSLATRPKTTENMISVIRGRMMAQATPIVVCL